MRSTIIKIIKDDSDIWYSLGVLKDAYVDAIVHDETISPHYIDGCIRNIMRNMLGNDAVEKMDLEIAHRKINIHDTELKLFKTEVLKLRKEINDIQKGGNG